MSECQLTLRVLKGSTLTHAELDNNFVSLRNCISNLSSQIGGSSFSGNTAESCITSLYVSNVYGCSPITLHNSIQSVDSFATGSTSLSFGYDSKAYGDTSFAFGYDVKASGMYSHAEGDGTIASGYGSHAEGNITVASGSGSHAEGNDTVASGAFSHTEGNQSTASGTYSHAEGNSSISSGHYSHAEGISTQSMGWASHTEGDSTIAKGSYQHVQGLYNLTASTVGAFIIGNGTSELDRRNLLFVGNNQMNLSGKTITTNLQVTSGASDGYVMTSDSDGNATWKSINNRYVEYRSNLTQTGVSAPSANMLGVTTLTGGTWSYSDVGSYFFTKIGAFSDPTKVEIEVSGTQVLAYPMTNSAFNLISASIYDNDTIEVRTSNWGAYPNVASGGTYQSVIIPGSTGLSVSEAMSNDILSNTRFVVRLWS